MFGVQAFPPHSCGVNTPAARPLFGLRPQYASAIHLDVRIAY